MLQFTSQTNNNKENLSASAVTEESAIQKEWCRQQFSRKRKPGSC